MTRPENAPDQIYVITSAPERTAHTPEASVHIDTAPVSDVPATPADVYKGVRQIETVTPDDADTPPTEAFAATGQIPATGTGAYEPACKDAWPDAWRTAFYPNAAGTQPTPQTKTFSALTLPDRFGPPQYSETWGEMDVPARRSRVVPILAGIATAGVAVALTANAVLNGDTTVLQPQPAPTTRYARVTPHPTMPTEAVIVPSPQPQELPRTASKPAIVAPTIPPAVVVSPSVRRLPRQPIAVHRPTVMPTPRSRPQPKTAVRTQVPPVTARSEQPPIADRPAATKTPAPETSALPTPQATPAGPAPTKTSEIATSPTPSVPIETSTTAPNRSATPNSQVSATPLPEPATPGMNPVETAGSQSPDKGPQTPFSPSPNQPSSQTAEPGATDMSVAPSRSNNGQISPADPSQQETTPSTESNTSDTADETESQNTDQPSPDSQQDSGGHWWWPW